MASSAFGISARPAGLGETVRTLSAPATYALPKPAGRELGSVGRQLHPPKTKSVVCAPATPGSRAAAATAAARAHDPLRIATSCSLWPPRFAVRPECRG